MIAQSPAQDAAQAPAIAARATQTALAAPRFENHLRRALRAAHPLSGAELPIRAGRIVLAGPPGAGCSMLAARLATEMLRSGLHEPEFYAQLQEALSLGHQTLRNTEINKMENESRALKSLIQSYHGLKRALRDWEYVYLMRSSTGGVVSFQKIWSANQQVNAGEPVFTVLPENKEELVGAMKIPAQNAGKVAVGLKVLIKLDNFPFQQYGALTGSVTRVAVSPDDEFNYLVYASLPEGTQTSFNTTIPFTQELLGNAEIITQDLSVAERLFFKFKSIMAN
jgi:hypothetical protein